MEFIYDLDAAAVYFMEMNTRLQVEHPVTEWVSGVDIVGEQLKVAGGESIEKLAIGNDGYAIEARVNAERLVETATGLVFQPSPGEIRECVFPDADGIDVIGAAAPGKFVSPYYDSMIAQVIARGPDRETTAGKLADYLDRVRIRGISTNVSLVKRILRDDVFLAGEYDTGYLPALLGRLDAAELIREIAEAAGDDETGIGREAIAIEDSDELKVIAPSTGIFYAGPSPTEPPYVSVGDRVGVDATLCQLEAFKIFTPVRLGDFNAPGQAPLYDAASQFEVRRVNVPSGQQVNAGDLLLVVRPVAS